MLLRGQFPLPYYQSWYIYRNAAVKILYFYSLIKAMGYMSVFKILIVFYSIDVLSCMLSYWQSLNDGQINKKTLQVFGIFAISFIVAIFWNLNEGYSKLKRGLGFRSFIWIYIYRHSTYQHKIFHPNITKLFILEVF